MRVLNLTPHDIQVYDSSQFVNLFQPKANLWLAEDVKGDPLAYYEPFYKDGRACRVPINTEIYNFPLPGEIVKTKYGEPYGLPPEFGEEDVIIVSLTTLNVLKEMGHRIAKKAFSPYKVVRKLNHTSKVLGCMGFTN